MSGRPIGPAPDWASDGVFPAGSDPWSGEVNTIEPSDAVKASGFVPGERPPADRLNWLIRAEERFATYQDAIEVQNWGAAQATGASTDDAEIKTLIWLDGSTLIHFLAFDEAVYSSISGQAGTWTTETTGGSGVILNGASVPQWVSDIFGTSQGTAAFVTNNQIQAFDDGTWNFDSAAVSAMASAVFRPSALADDLWIVGARAHPAGWVPALVYYLRDATEQAIVQLSLPSGYVDTNANITHSALSKTGATVVVAGETGNSTDVAWWRAPAGGTITWTLHRLTGFTRRANSFFYSYEADAFYLLCDDRFFKSTDDGVSFQEIVGASPPFAGGARHSVVAYGGVWLAVKRSSGRQQAAWSVDEGRSWNAILDPFAAVSAAEYAIQRPFVVRDRFALVADADGDTNPHQIVYSLRVKGL